MSKTASKSIKINLKNVCRSCLSERGHLRNIYSTELPKMMEFCASVKVSESDSLPGTICSTCFHLIAKFYSFKLKMEESDHILREYVKNNIKKSNIINLAINDAKIHERDHDTFVSTDEDVTLNQICIQNVKSFTTEEVTQINNFTVEPPPLVPLEPKTVEQITGETTQNISNVVPSSLPTMETKEEIQTKEEVHSLLLTCPHCNQKFHSVSDYKQHKLNIHTPQRVFQCNICQKVFKESNRLIGHLKGHIVVKDYHCTFCEKRYPSQSSLRVHLRTHTGEKPFQCNVCSKGFIRWAGLVEHMKTHEPHKPYKCNACGKCFKIASNLERHKVLHLDSLPYCCCYCGKMFAQKNNIKTHVQTHHTKDRPFLCQECGKSFVSATSLKRHMYVHSGFKPYQCKLCPKSYINSTDLKTHEKNHHSKDSASGKKPFTCRICDKRFTHARRLKTHMKTHVKPS